MTRAWWGAIAALLLALVGAALALTAPPKPVQKPRLALLTTLPIVFGEDFGLRNAATPAWTALNANFRVAPISTTSPSELRKPLLLMAQPSAQAPENLVALDRWVRAGGRLLLLADPMLEWPSKRPLGDPLRPPPMFADTGLLAHWGLRLDAPDQRRPVLRSLGDYRVLTASPGKLYGGCAISSDRLVADCKIGKGRAIVVADADLLDVSDLGPQAKDNLTAIVSQLESLASR